VTWTRPIIKAAGLAVLAAARASYALDIPIPAGCTLNPGSQNLKGEERFRAENPELSAVILVGPLQRPTAAEGGPRTGVYVDVLVLREKRLQIIVQAALVSAIHTLDCGAKRLITVELWTTPEESDLYRVQQAQSGAEFHLMLSGAADPAQARAHRRKERPPAGRGHARPSSAEVTAGGKRYLFENGKLRRKD